ncbi:MAG: hypothetical protein ABFS08_08030 [Pseudomonadota bacterium]
MGKQIIALMLLGMSASVLAETIDGVMLKYMVSESGLEPHPSRIIVTKALVRMDDGEPGGDYLLFDREKQLISSVTHEDDTVLEIPMREVPQKPPITLKRDHTLELDAKAPEIGGKQPYQLRLFVNEKLCYDAVVVPGLLPDTVKALRSFNRVLAGEQGKMLGELPSEMIEGCDLALHTFHPEWLLESGLAIQEFDVSMRRGRLLVDIDPVFKAKAKLFELPADYKRYSTP